jgi:FkbM family methyltransferase
MNVISFLPDPVKERLRRRAGTITMRARLQNIRAAGFVPRKIIDGGAFHGEWAKMAASIFPEASFLLIEPQAHLEKQLAALCRTLPSARLRSALLGRARGNAHFVIDESNSRIVSDPKGWPASRLVSIGTETLADVVVAEDFVDCDFLKLDLQGHELEALAGAGPFFGSVEVILLECSWLPIGPVPIAAEVIATVSAHGYRLYDVMGFNYRPFDRALWQTDFIFVRQDSSLFAHQHDWS